MKQTAVEWLKKELEEYGSPSHLNLDWSTFDELCEQAIEMEKQQLRYCYDYEMSERTDWDDVDKMFEKFYNETYKQ